MRLYDRESQDTAALAMIGRYRRVANYYAGLCKAADEFDGKVFNKRFTERIKNYTGAHITAEKRYSFIDFYCYEYGSCYTVARIKFEDMADGKRINAKKFKESALEARNKHLKEAAEIQRTMENADTLINQIEQLRKTLEAITGSVTSYTAKDIYNLNVRIQ